MKYKRIIFSGVNGPLGHALNLLTKNDRRFLPFSSQECDLRLLETVRSFFSNLVAEINPSEVAYVHLAAKSGGVRFSTTKPATAFVDNMQMAINVLQVCQEIGISRVLMTLSTSCYAETLKAPNELQIHEGPIISPDFSYAYSKRMQEVLMRSYNKQFGMDVSSVLVNGIIGPKMSFDPEKSILPASLIREFEKNANTSNKIDVVVDSSVRREYTYSNDLAKILLWCVEHQETNSLLNIGNTQSVGIKKIALYVAKALKIEEARLNFIERKSTGRLIQSTSNRKFLQENNFQYTDISLAIADAVAWFLKSKKGWIDHE